MRGNSSITEKEKKKAEEFLKTFYLPLPAVIKEDPVRTLFSPVKNPEISIEEVRIKVFKEERGSPQQYGAIYGPRYSMRCLNYLEAPGTRDIFHISGERLKLYR